MQLWCMACQSPNDFDRNWVQDDDECRVCQSKGRWRTVNDPKVEWALGHMDKRFLKSIHVTQA